MTWHTNIGHELSKLTGLASTESGTICDGCGRFERARRGAGKLGKLKVWAQYGTTPRGWREILTEARSRHQCPTCAEAR